MMDKTELIKRLVCSVETNPMWIAERLRDICMEHEKECKGCIWFTPEIGIGCVWRVRSDVPPCDWRMINNG